MRELAGDLEGYVDRTAVVLIFLSRGYFLSKNCMREVRAAVQMGKPLVLVHETNTGKGGAPLAALRAECPDDVRDAVFGPPDRPAPVIPWRRIESFQIKSLQLIAEQMLGHLRAQEPFEPPELYLPGALSGYTWSLSPPARVIVSSNNPGAIDTARRLAAFVAGGALIVPSDDELHAWCRSVASAVHAQQSAASPREQARPSPQGDRVSPRRSRTATDAAVAAPAVIATSKKAGVPHKPHAVAKASSTRARGPSAPTGGRRRTTAAVWPATAAVEPSVAPTTGQQGHPEQGGGAAAMREAPTEGEGGGEAVAVKLKEASTASTAGLDGRYFLLYLNKETFVGAQGDELANEVRYILGLPGGGREIGAKPAMQIVMVHEQCEARGGCEFDRFFATTPRDLVVGGLYKDIALSLYDGPYEAISLAECCRSMGLEKAHKEMRSASARSGIVQRCTSMLPTLALPALDYEEAAVMIQKVFRGYASRSRVTDDKRGVHHHQVEPTDTEADDAAMALTELPDYHP